LKETAQEMMKSAPLNVP